MAKRYIFQMRRGTAAQWAANNSIIPMAGEIVIEIDETNSYHKLKIGDGVHAYADLAYLMAGDEVVTQVLTKALPRVVTVELTTNWIQNAEGKYSQTITLDNITSCSRLDLQPDTSMIAEFKEHNLIFTTENINGTITVYSLGDMPLKSYTMQATIIETDAECEKIVGMPVGVPGTHVDMTYSSTSTNPQSGVAVAEAIAENKQYIDAQVETITSGKLKREVVAELPNIEVASENTLYMVGPKEDDTYDEYMFVAGKFELIGTTSVDLSGYVTIDNLETSIDDAIAEAKANGEFNGMSITVSEVIQNNNSGEYSEVKFSDGKSVQIKNGEDGNNGGYYIPSVIQTADTAQFSFEPSSADMPTIESAQIILPKGEAGYTPVRGTDYWTEADVAEIQAYIDENASTTPTPSVISVAGRTGDVTLSKDDVGLGNVDNTSDLEKPISTATQEAIDAVEAIATTTSADLYTHEILPNPHGVDKEAIGLGNVDNTSDTNKPVSEPTKTYISETVPDLISATMSSLGAVRIERKIHTGNGKFGMDNPCSVTFDNGTPVVVMISPEGSGLEYYWGVIFGNKGFVFETKASNSSPGFCITASVSGNTISWYAGENQSQYIQMNKNQETYNVIGFIL